MIFGSVKRIAALLIFFYVGSKLPYFCSASSQLHSTVPNLCKIKKINPEVDDKFNLSSCNVFKLGTAAGKKKIELDQMKEPAAKQHLLLFGNIKQE